MEVWAVGDLPVKDDEDGGGEGQVDMPYMLRESMLIVYIFRFDRNALYSMEIWRIVPCLKLPESKCIRMDCVSPAWMIDGGCCC